MKGAKGEAVDCRGGCFFPPPPLTRLLWWTGNKDNGKTANRRKFVVGIWFFLFFFVFWKGLKTTPQRTSKAIVSYNQQRIFMPKYSYV